MKKLVWFVKENGKVREITMNELLALTSHSKELKITEYDIDNETHKVVEFTKENIINA
jgi:hypothetical protein